MPKGKGSYSEVAFFAASERSGLRHFIDIEVEPRPDHNARFRAPTNTMSVLYGPTGEVQVREYTFTEIPVDEMGAPPGSARRILLKEPLVHDNEVLRWVFGERMPRIELREE